MTLSSSPLRPSADLVVVPARGVASRKGCILMLHGWAQNATVFQIKTKSLTKKLTQAGYDCVFLDAPHVLPPLVATTKVATAGTKQHRKNARAWFWYSATDPTDIRESRSSGVPMTYWGLDASLNLIQEELLLLSRESSGFCAILGFSQGAVLCHILSQLTKGKPELFGSIQAAIVASGFASQHVDTSPPTKQQVSNQGSIAVPSLHLIGSKDTSVKPMLSEELAILFADREFLYHDKGHVLPQRSTDCQQIIAFLDCCRTKAMEM